MTRTLQGQANRSARSLTGKLTSPVTDSAIAKSTDEEKIVPCGIDLSNCIGNANIPFADMEILCETQIFKCHKMILCLRSPVFQAMFEQQMTESLTNTIIMNDFKPPVIELFLKCLYGGGVPKAPNEALLGLWSIANKYQVNSLKIAVGLDLFKQISVKTASELYHQAIIHNNEVLLELVTNFAHHNRELASTNHEIPMDVLGLSVLTMDNAAASIEWVEEIDLSIDPFDMERSCSFHSSINIRWRDEFFHLVVDLDRCLKVITTTFDFVGTSENDGPDGEYTIVAQFIDDDGNKIAFEDDDPAYEEEPSGLYGLIYEISCGDLYKLGKKHLANYPLFRMKITVNREEEE